MTDPIDRLGALLHQRDGDEGAERDVAARERFIAQLTEQKRPARTDRRPLILVAALAFGVGALMVRLQTPDPTPVPAAAPVAMAFSIEGDASDRTELRAEGDTPARVRFEDGTTFEVRGGTATIGPVTPDGATIALEEGALQADVTPDQGHRWVVAAGPYTVLVTGTRFSVEWSAKDRRVGVKLERGEVRVRGPLIGDTLVLEPGQQLEGDVRGEELRVGRLTAAPAPSATASAAPPSAADVPHPAPVSWAERVAAGEYAVVIAEAEARGIEAVMSSGSVGRLVALGDAARYEGRGDLARRCLKALRSRFPDSPAGKSAAFLLGRMSEGSPATAIGWYDRYLAESPSGAYAAQALGRKLALLAQSDRARARPVARQYLQLYPKGAYAELARSLK